VSVTPLFWVLCLTCMPVKLASQTPNSGIQWPFAYVPWTCHRDLKCNTSQTESVPAPACPRTLLLLFFSCTLFFFIIILLLNWGHVVTFTKVLTIYYS
jgi:hypothetical protein